MTLKIGASLQSILSSAPHQAAWGALLSNSFGTSGIRFRCKRDASSSAPDPWATGTEFLNIGMAGPLSVDSETGEITLGALAGTTVSSPADLSSGKSVFRIEANGYYIEGTFGLTGSGCDLIVSGSSTARTGYALSGATIRPPSGLPINANGVTIGGVLTDVTMQNTSSSSSITDQAFTFGQVFKKGAMPASGAAVSMVGPTTIAVQMDVKATHSDGSVRHAIISGVVPSLAASTSATYNLVRISSSAATPAVPSDFSGLSSVVTITESGATYTAALSDLLTSSYKTWISGGVASEWYGIAPLKTSGGATHPYLTVRFNARAYKGKGKARVSISVENSSVVLNGTTPLRHCIYSIGISVGGTSVFNQATVAHLPYTRFRKIFWWGGAAPSMHIRHNSAYLIATKAFPQYDPSIINNTDTTRESGYMTQLNANRDIFGSGVALKYMPNTGGRPDIGLMTGWDTLYLLGMTPTMREVSLNQSDLMGSWSVHKRDTSTDQAASAIDRPDLSVSPQYRFTITNVTGSTSATITLSENHNFVVGMYTFITELAGDLSGLNFGVYPITAVTTNTITVTLNGNTNITGAIYSGGGKVLAENINNYEGAHCPAQYLPYVLSGDLHHLEEIHSYAMAAGAGQYTHDRQLRAQAWALRDFAHAAYITPDADRLKSHFKSLLDLNIADYDSRYTNNSTANALGAVVGGSAWSDPDFAGNNVRPWQDDFITQTMGHIVELGFKNALQFFLYKAKFPVGRMNYCRMLSSPYQLKLRATYPGDPYSTIEQCQIATYPLNYPQAGSNILAQPFDSAGMGTQLAPVFFESSIAANSMMGGAPDPLGYPANLQPALAYASTLNAPNGAAMWSKFEGRSVKPGSGYNAEPQFAIVPRSA